MADTNVSNLGQIEGAGLTDELFMKVFSGEVMTIFEAENKTKGRVMSRSINSGKSASFPVMGRASAYYHTPGNEILGGSIKHNEKVITIDDLLISPAFIAEIDEAKNHYDVRGHYSTEVGRVLAQTWDKHALQVGVLAARTSTGNIAGESPAGTILAEGTSGDYDDVTKFHNALRLAAEKMDEKNIPEQDRAVYVRPAAYWRLIDNDKLVSKEFSEGNGDVAKGVIYRVAGMELIKTNNLPNTNVTASSVAAGTGDKYVGDFSKTEALVMHKSAIGTVQLMDLSTRMDYDPRRLGTQVVSKYAVGHGILRPEAAVELMRL